MRNVLIHSSMTTDNNVEIYKDIFGNNYIISADAYIDDPIVPFVATVKDDFIELPMDNGFGQFNILVKEITTTFKNIETLRSYLVTQMEIDKVTNLMKERA